MYAAQEGDYSIEEAYENLGFAIVERAVIDYDIALRRWKHAISRADEIATRAEVESFERWLRSEWCYYLTQGRLDGDTIISTMRHNVLGDDKYKNLY